MILGCPCLLIAQTCLVGIKPYSTHFTCGSGHLTLWATKAQSERAEPTRARAEPTRAKGQSQALCLVAQPTGCACPKFTPLSRGWGRRHAQYAACAPHAFDKTFHTHGGAWCHTHGGVRWGVGCPAHRQRQDAPPSEVLLARTGEAGGSVRIEREGVEQEHWLA